MEPLFYVVLGHRNESAPRFETKEHADAFVEQNGGMAFPVADMKITKIPVDELRVLEIEDDENVPHEELMREFGLGDDE